MNLIVFYALFAIAFVGAFNCLFFNRQPTKIKCSERQEPDTLRRDDSDPLQ